MFIVLEGPDSSGKTTQIKLLESYLKDNNKKYTLLREPGGTELGEQCRNILLDGGLDKRSELALFFAARADLVNKEILTKKKLEFVICDRYVDSTVAYQCYGNESISEKHLKPMLEYFSYNVRPDVTFVLDVDYQTALKRMEDRKNNHYDVAGEEYFNRVHAYYQSLNGKDKYCYIDTSNLDIENVHKKIIHKIANLELQLALPIPAEYREQS